MLGPARTSPGRAQRLRDRPNRLGDVLELRRTEIADREIKPPLHLPVGLLGETNRARLGDAFQSRGDIDAVAHQIAVALLDDIPEVNANAEDDASVLRQAGVALDHGVLHFDGAAHGVDHAAELDDRAVAGALDDPPWCTEIVGSIRSLRRARSRASVRSSSAPASRL